MSENEMLEEIKSLSPSEEAILTMLIRYQNLKAELEKEKEKNKFLNWYFENQKDNFVHKDKIKAKIEEYEKELNKLLQKEEWLEPHDTIKRNKYMHYIEFGNHF